MSIRLWFYKRYMYYMRNFYNWLNRRMEPSTEKQEQFDREWQVFEDKTHADIQAKINRMIATDKLIAETAVANYIKEKEIEND